MRGKGVKKLTDHEYKFDLGNGSPDEQERTERTEEAGLLFQPQRGVVTHRVRPEVAVTLWSAETCLRFRGLSDLSLRQSPESIRGSAYARERCYTASVLFFATHRWTRCCWDDKSSQQ